MTTSVTLQLNDTLLERVTLLAENRGQEVAQAIIAHLEATLPNGVRAKHADPLDFEMDAFLRLHPQLVKTHYGKYVAIFNGELVDSDVSADLLFERIELRFPDESVWIAQVTDEPIQTLHIPSFRLSPQ